MSFASIRTRVDNLSRVPSEVVSQTDGGQRDECIQDALREYSKHRPRPVTLVIATLGGSTYRYSLSDAMTAAGYGAWSEACQVQAIRYPVGYQSENEVDANDYWIYRDPTDNEWYLHWKTNAPAGGYSMWVLCGIPHVLDANTDTIATHFPLDADAFAALAASRVLIEASTYYTRNQQSTIGAAAMAFKTKGKDCSDRAKELREEYERQVLGDANAGASGMVDWDSQQYLGYDYTFWRTRRS